LVKKRATSINWKLRLIIMSGVLCPMATIIFKYPFSMFKYLFHYEDCSELLCNLLIVSVKHRWYRKHYLMGKKGQFILNNIQYLICKQINAKQYKSYIIQIIAKLSPSRLALASLSLVLFFNSPFNHPNSLRNRPPHSLRNQQPHSLFGGWCSA
jgi:hypothetical protein